MPQIDRLIETKNLTTEVGLRVACATLNTGIKHMQSWKSVGLIDQVPVAVQEIHSQMALTYSSEVGITPGGGAQINLWDCRRAISDHLLGLDTSKEERLEDIKKYLLDKMITLTGVKSEDLSIDEMKEFVVAGICEKR